MHEHHRRRMRERYLQSGFEGFATHEILEFLLYYSIPRADTNKTAHALLNRFGSLKGIFNASLDELMEVRGIGQNSAMLLKLIPEITRRYANETAPSVKAYDSLSKISEFFCQRFIGLENECLYMALFNNRMNIIECLRISEGSVNRSTVPVRRMTELALRKKASSVVVAHNHPNGLAVPSSNDLEVTDTLHQAFHTVGVTLIEHLIVVDDRVCPIMQKRYSAFRCSPVSGEVESGFYEAFYNVDPDLWRASPFVI